MCNTEAKAIELRMLEWIDKKISRKQLEKEFKDHGIALESLLSYESVQNFIKHRKTWNKRIKRMINA
jgi:hypothetical protein